MVGTLVFGETILVQVVVKAYKTLLLGAVVLDDDSGRVDIFYYAVADSIEQHAAVFGNRLFNAGTDDRNLWVEQRYSLAHHIRTHKCTVCVVVLEERNQ